MERWRDNYKVTKLTYLNSSRPSQAMYQMIIINSHQVLCL